MNKWCRVNRILKALFILDLDMKKSNRKIFGCFTLLLLITIVNQVAFLSQGLFLKSNCAEAHQDSAFGDFFFHQIFPEIFKILPFHFLLGVFVLTADSLLSFAWMFNDAFIIVISLLIARNFENFNRRISLNIHVRSLRRAYIIILIFYPQNKSRKFWIEHIDAYKKLCNHVNCTSELLGVVIVISFLINLYIVCVRLLVFIRWASCKIVRNLLKKQSSSQLIFCDSTRDRQLSSTIFTVAADLSFSRCLLFCSKN